MLVFRSFWSTAMQALTYHGRKDVRVETVPDPVLAAEDDLILRVTPPPSVVRTCTCTGARFLTCTMAMCWATNSWAWWKRSAAA